MRTLPHKGRQFIASKQTLKNSKATNKPKPQNQPPTRITKVHFANRNKAHWDEIILPEKNMCKYKDSLPE